LINAPRDQERFRTRRERCPLLAGLIGFPGSGQQFQNVRQQAKSDLDRNESWHELSVDFDFDAGINRNVAEKSILCIAQSRKS
jgi:hypothetical protein